MPSPPPPLTILVAPLNWGLGHATRCIPIIQELQARGCQVIVASDGASRALLVEEFPELTHISSPHTEIRYSKSPRWFGWAILKLIPRFWFQIKREQRWIRSVVSAFRIQAIIADNRYGMAHPNIPSIIITHQLGIQTGYGAAVDRLIQRISYHYIDRYRAVWVPDLKDEPSLAGALSHPIKYPSIPVAYLGMLNRFARSTNKVPSDTEELSTARQLIKVAEATTFESGAALPEKRPILVLLSGPEPQRTLLEKLILKEAASFKGSLIILKGLPASSATTDTAPVNQHHLQELYGLNQVRQFDHLGAAELQALLPSVEYIICRSGYTTLMEMIPLQKKLLLIPTPGQPEQLYLAVHADQQHYAPFWRQDKFSLIAALEEASRYSYHFPKAFNKDHLSAVIAALVDQLNDDTVQSA